MVRVPCGQVVRRNSASAGSMTCRHQDRPAVLGARVGEVLVVYIRLLLSTAAVDGHRCALGAASEMRMANSPSRTPQLSSLDDTDVSDNYVTLASGVPVCNPNPGGRRPHP